MWRITFREFASQPLVKRPEAEPQLRRQPRPVDDLDVFRLGRHRLDGDDFLDYLFSFDDLRDDALDLDLSGYDFFDLDRNLFLDDLGYDTLNRNFLDHFLDLGLGYDLGLAASGERSSGDDAAAQPGDKQLSS